MDMQPVVLDCYHGDAISDWQKLKAAGIRGILLKATQGSTGRDPLYKERVADAKANGFLVGAYHFLTVNASAQGQADNFLDVVRPQTGDGILLAVDHETLNGRGASLAQLKGFLQIVGEKTGRTPIIYSGNLIKEQLAGKADPFLSGHPLWLCEYGPHAVLPPGWSGFWLWQFTGDGEGPGPHVIDGVATKNIDLNVFGGADLETEWAMLAGVPAAQPEPVVAEAHPVVKVATHPATWGLAGLVAAGQGICQHVSGLFQGDIGDVVTDTQNRVSPVTSLLDMAHARSPEVDTALVIFFLLFVLFHVHKKA